jgi:hypothetical protein
MSDSWSAASCGNGDRKSGTRVAIAFVLRIRKHLAAPSRHGTGVPSRCRFFRRLHPVARKSRAAARAFPPRRYCTALEMSGCRSNARTEATRSSVSLRKRIQKGTRQWLRILRSTAQRRQRPVCWHESGDRCGSSFVRCTATIRSCTSSRVACRCYVRRAATKPLAGTSRAHRCSTRPRLNGNSAGSGCRSSACGGSRSTNRHSSSGRCPADAVIS